MKLRYSDDKEETLCLDILRNRLDELNNKCASLQQKMDAEKRENRALKQQLDDTSSEHLYAERKAQSKIASLKNELYSKKETKTKFLSKFDNLSHKLIVEQESLQESCQKYKLKNIALNHKVSKLEAELSIAKTNSESFNDSNRRNLEKEKRNAANLESDLYRSKSEGNKQRQKMIRLEIELSQRKSADTQYEHALQHVEKYCRDKRKTTYV